MNIVRRIIVGLAGVVVVALAMELAAPKAVRAVVSTLVTVANTSANPVPVAGNVAVTNTVPISGNVNVTNVPAVQLSGTPSVNIANPLSIGGNVSATVVNTPASPVPTLSAEALNSFTAFLTQPFSAEGFCTVPLYTVPSGQIAVIQSVGYLTQMDQGTAIDFNSIVDVNSSGSLKWELYLPVGSPVLQTFAPAAVASSGGLTITAYATAGDQISFDAFTTASETASTDHCNATISGYTVPAP